MTKHVVVIGSGFGGLAAALRARALGHRVTLVERLEQLGGRARTFHEAGYTFDAGPTVLTAPFLFEELFALFGKRLNDYVELLAVEPWYRYEFPDGSSLNYGGTVEDTLAEIHKLSPRDVVGYQRLLRASKEIFEVGFNQLAHVPFNRFSFMLRQIPKLVRLGCYRTVWQFTRRYLHDDRLRRAFSIQPLLVGGNPFSTTCIYSLIHYLERRWGVHYPRGGTGALVSALATLLEEEGVEIRMTADVAQLEIDQSRISGVRLESGELIPAEVVVCNGDPVQVHRELIDRSHRRYWTNKRLARLQLSMGLYVLYFGTRRKYENIQHHTIIFGKRYEELLSEIFDGTTIDDDLSLYLHRPTATDATLAPEGHDAFYVLAPVPNLQSMEDWTTARDKIRERVFTILEDRVLPGLREQIDVCFDFSPQEFKEQYRSAAGAGFSIAPLFSQSAYFRFHNKSQDVQGLYFVGAGTHPGAGVPGVVTSAKVFETFLLQQDGHEEQAA